MSLREDLNISSITEKTGNADQNVNIPPYVSYTIIGFISIVITLNIPSLIVLLFTKVKASNFVSVHILSLAVTDCGVGLSLLLVVLARTNNYWDCWTRLFVNITMYINSMTQVAALCLDRVIMFHNVKWKSITKNSTLLIKIILTTYLITLVISIIPCVVLATPNDISKCGLDNLFDEGKRTLLLYFGICFTCIEVFVILCTVILIRFLWKRKFSKRRVNPHPTIQSNNNTMDKETRAMVTLGIIVALYIILNTPLHVLMLFYGIAREEPSQNIFMPIAALACLNSAVNPIVYSFRIPEMKEAFKTLWHKMRCW
ncbi:Adenosine receptor A2a [Mizuhopecten yessoensis]|uniref:Adenosine receptor A2a n=1 Tax=Mizuhopecten yessoensis TaxID=6573 RepID=A0A210PEU9_MIZYE|nr:Adenosine receptor A2a [Mizuhopecten yessoensis]